MTDYLPPKPPLRLIPSERSCPCWNAEICETCRYTYGYMRARHNLNFQNVWASLWSCPIYSMGYADGEQDQIEAELNYG